MTSVRDVLLAGQKYLEQSGAFPPVQARRETESLLAKLLDVDRLGVYLKFDQPLRERELATLRIWLKRRSKRYPLQYLLGSVEFLGATYHIPEGVFIPRPETEEWVEWVCKLPLELFHSGAPPERILDVGIGCGVIVCTLLSTWHNAVAVGIDSSEAAVAAARANAQHLGVLDRLSLHNIRAGRFHIPQSERRFDFVVSNPPYIAESERATLPQEVNYEPDDALFGGTDGLAAFRTFAKKLPEWLVAGGACAFEIGAGQAAAVEGLLRPLLDGWFVRNDAASLPRLIGGRLR